MDIGTIFRLLTMTGAKQDENGTFQVKPTDLFTFNMLAEAEKQTNSFFDTSFTSPAHDWDRDF